MAEYPAQTASYQLASFPRISGAAGVVTLFSTQRESLCVRRVVNDAQQITKGYNLSSQRWLYCSFIMTNTNYRLACVSFSHKVTTVFEITTTLNVFVLSQ